VKNKKAPKGKNPTAKNAAVAAVPAEEPKSRENAKILSFNL
jgi:hypothetical protein